eukprot:TRINITY_DN5493_c0_g1_i2.p1 TRINITY_DN5493_c0_g1~~TRINITY_DN5493_c0_g1_i2.p1  ORF type:complete len:418 (-),score=56.84 TRINITY_DN5493_c0_g1_i2:520-1773(-)
MPPKSVASVVRPLVWLRNDLRLSDNVALASSLKHGSPILLFCFDLRQFVQIDYGFRKTGAWRARFLLECVTDLKRSCQALNSDLVVRVGKPEQHIEEIIARYGITQVFAQKETTSEEIDVETKVARACQSHNATLNLVWGSTLFHIDDIPFRPRDVPDIFTTFRKRVENESQIRNLFPRPEKLDSLPEVLDAGNVPRLEDLGFDVKETGRVQRQPGRQVGFSLLGGESHAMARMTDFIWTKNLLREYKDIRNGMLGMDYSTKLSPYLAHGCISARQIYFEVLKYEEQREKNDSTYWLLFELVWRDYFRFVSIKYGTRLFFRDGMIGAGKKKTWKANPLMFEAWKNGRTGYPLVDANMREMLATGSGQNKHHCILFKQTYSCILFYLYIISVMPFHNYENNGSCFLSLLSLFRSACLC